MGLLNATVIYNKKLNDEYHILRVQPRKGEISDFMPGQYAELGILDPSMKATDPNQKVIRRLYSIASPNSIKDYLEFYVVAVKDGLVSPRITTKKEGDLVYLNPQISGKFGNNLEVISKEKDVICIATGTGLAPYISMFKSFENNPPWKSFTIVHGVRFSRDLGYRDELETYVKKYNNFFYLPTVTRETLEENGWYGLNGRVGMVIKRGDYENLTGLQISPRTTVAMICGGKDMVEDLVKQFTDRGFSKGTATAPGNLFFERYW